MKLAIVVRRVSYLENMLNRRPVRSNYYYQGVVTVDGVEVYRSQPSSDLAEAHADAEEYVDDIRSRSEGEYVQ